MKHIVMFSGGAASAFVGKLVATMHGKESTILLHTPTYSEHPDADRFREQVAKFIGLSITEQADGRSVWQLIEQYHALPSYFMPFCTEQLKIAQTNKFLKTVNDDFILYYGYGAEEWGRVQKQSARLAAKSIKSAYPLFKLKSSNEAIKSVIRDDWRICLPEPYKHLKHNNCIPCWKGGKDHFRAVAKYYPEEFKKAMAAEESTGHTQFQDCTLQDIWDEVESGKAQITIEGMSDIPCMCAF